MVPATELPPDITDLLLIRLAREVAIDHLDTDAILKNYQINIEIWQKIQAMPRFQEVLRSEVEAWNTATNTHERTKLKAAAIMEQWLPEAFRQLHLDAQPLNAKVELGKLIARIAGMGVTGMGVEGAGGERFSVTINLGADASLRFDKQVPAKVIEATPTEP
jgi:hypothetical protein